MSEKAVINTTITFTWIGFAISTIALFLVIVRHFQ